MKLSDFDYNLPKELIAQEPLKERTASRLLVMNRESGEIQDKQFSDIIDFINPNDLLIFNDTKVIPARLFGRKETGGKIEILVERLLEDNEVLVHIRANKSPKLGSTLILDGDVNATVTAKEDGLYQIKFICDSKLKI
jgi:S-adenosylmethionine:tRNA ribosyltransferase-isomerase